MTPLSPEELHVLESLIAETDRLGYQPTIAELVPMTSAGVHAVLKRIAAKGWIEMTGKARAILIPESTRAMVSRPWKTENELRLSK